MNEAKVYIGKYFLERECLPPPSELQKMIFPNIEFNEAQNNQKPEEERDVATTCFLQLLQWFRVILLQDCVFLRQKFPSLRLWNEAPFNHVLFEDFASRLLHEAYNGPDPTYMQIARTIPHVAQLLKTQHQEVMSNFQVQRQSITTQVDTLREKVAICAESVRPLQPIFERLCNGGLNIQTTIRLDQDNTINQQLSQTGEAAPNSMPISNSMETDPVPRYRLQKWITTVSKLWEEYDRGVLPQSPTAATNGMRGPSIRELNRNYDTKWRRDTEYRNAYARRKCIWEAVNDAAEKLGLHPEDVARRIDLWRVSKATPIGLLKLNDILRAVEKKEMPPIWGQDFSGLLEFP